MKIGDWFSKGHSVCVECGVHFEPVEGSEARWGNLCKAHRKAVMERDLKRDAVLAWAGRNWEKLVAQMERENAEASATYNRSMQSSLNALGNAALMQQQAQQAQQAFNVYGLNSVLGNLSGRPGHL